MGKIESHIEATDYLSQGNREADKLAQDRKATLGPLRLIVPNEWKDGENGLNKVPQPDKINMLKQVHEGLGHVGGDRVVKWLKSAGLDVPGARGLVINLRKSCPECTRAGG